MGLTLLIFGVKTEENQNKTDVIVRNTLYDTTFNVDEHGYQVKKIMLNANITILASISVTGMVGGDDKSCIDLYVLNNISYASWLRKEAEHRKDPSWFMKEEDVKYISVEVHGTGKYVFDTDHIGTYYFVLDNSGRCSKTVSFKLFEVERIGTEPSTGGNSQLTERLSLLSGAGLLALGLILLLYGFSSEPPPIEAIKGQCSSVLNAAGILLDFSTSHMGSCGVRLYEEKFMPWAVGAIMGSCLLTSSGFLSTYPSWFSTLT